MTMDADISTSVRRWRWRRTTGKFLGPPLKLRSHIYVSFCLFLVLSFTIAFPFWASSIGWFSCIQTLPRLRDYSIYNPWPVSQLLTINLGFGTMPFSTAKLVDVLWDVVVGRGGQMLLTYIAYHIFTKSLTRTMEDSQVSYHTFAAFAFESGTTTGLFMLAKDFASNRSLRSKMIVSWVLAATLHIVAFPTLSSAMTGYTSVMEAYLEDKSQNLIRWALFTSVSYIIVDADRIDPYFKSNTLVWISESEADHLLYEATEAYLSAYEHSWTFPSNINSTFKIGAHSYPLGPPLLNIIQPNSYMRINDTSTTYDQPWVDSHLSCQPMRSTYQWGFSFTLTFIFLILNTVWSIGMYAMWMDAHENSRVDRSGRETGGMFRSVVDLATAIQRNLGKAADQCSNSELEKRLKRSHGGLDIPLDELPQSRREERRKRRKMKKERRGSSEEQMVRAQPDECLTTN